MLNPPPYEGRERILTYPRGRLLHYLALGFRILQDSNGTKTSVNKRLLICPSV